MSRSLLMESFEGKSFVDTDKEGKKRYYIEGICIQTNIKNGNNRIYPKEIVDREVARYIDKYLNKGRAVGELNHPEERLEIDPRFISHKFESLTPSGNDWICRARVAEGTNMGSIVAGLMDCGVQMGMSTRGSGSTKQSGGVHVVQDDFCLISAGDVVWEPSAPDAFMTNLMENREWVYANGLLFEKETQIKKKVNSLAKSKQLNEENLNKLFSIIINHIKEGAGSK